MSVRSVKLSLSGVLLVGLQIWPGSVPSVRAQLSVVAPPASSAGRSSGAAPEPAPSRQSALTGGAYPKLSPQVTTSQPLVQQPARQEAGPGGAGPSADSAEPKKAAIGPLLELIGCMAPTGWLPGEAVTRDNPDSSFDQFMDGQTVDELREFRCSGMVRRSFQRGGRKVVITAYCFEGPEGAFGAYCLMRQGASTVIRRGDASSEDDQNISFWQDNYFVVVSTTAEDDDEAKQLQRMLADQMAQGINRHAEVPAVVADLPRLDRVAGSERFLLGPIVARRVASLPFLGLLALAGSRGAAVSDYQFQQPYPERMRLLLVDYGNSEAAAAVFRRYTAALLEEHRARLSDTDGLFRLSSSYLYCQLRGQLLLIVSGARNRLSPVILARQLAN